MGVTLIKYPDYTDALIKEMEINEAFKERVYGNKRIKISLDVGNALNASQVIIIDKFASDYSELRAFDYCKTFWQYAYIDMMKTGSISKFLNSIGIHVSRISHLMNEKGISFETRVKFIDALIKKSNCKKAIESYKIERERVLREFPDVKSSIIAIANKYDISFKDIAMMLNVDVNDFIKMINNINKDTSRLDKLVIELIKDGHWMRDEYFWSIPSDIRAQCDKASTPRFFKMYKEGGDEYLNPYRKFEDNKTMYRLVMLEVYGGVKEGFRQLGFDKLEWKSKTYRRLATNFAIKELLNGDPPEIYKEFLNARLDIHNNADQINKLRAEILNEDKDLYNFIVNNVGSVYNLHIMMQGKPIGYRRTRDIYHLARYFRPDDKRMEIFNVDTWDKFENLSLAFHK